MFLILKLDLMESLGIMNKTARETPQIKKSVELFYFFNRFWQPQNWFDNNYILDNIQMEDRGSSLIIQKTGLYLIYAQVMCHVINYSNSLIFQLITFPAVFTVVLCDN